MAAVKPVRIGLLWHSINSDNLGVGALTVANIDILKRVVAEAGLSAEFIVLGFVDSGPSYIEDKSISAIQIRTKSLLNPFGQLAQAIRGCDLICDIGAGDSFTDIYGAKRALFMLRSKVMVLRAGHPLVLSPQTVGPFERWWTRLWAASIMRRCTSVVSRDQLSTDFLGELGLGARVTDATDVAFRLPYDAAPRGSEGPTKVGINVSGLLMNGGYTGDNMFGLTANYPELMRRIIGHFHDLPDSEVHLVGHVLSETMPIEDDFRANQALAQEFPRAVVAPRFEGPSQAKSYISGLDFFCGARMHACIAAFSSGVPVIPIAYSRKFAGVFGSLGYRRIADAKTETTDQIFRRVVDAFDDLPAIHAEIEQSMTHVDARIGAYEAALTDAIEQAVGR